MTGLKLTDLQWRVLAAVTHWKVTTVSQIAQTFRRSPGNIVDALNVLREAGLIEKMNSLQWRRPPKTSK